MKKGWFKHFLQKSGPCIDSIDFLTWINQQHWSKSLFLRCLRFRFSPALLEDALQKGEGNAFSTAISQISTGETFKTTHSGRTIKADKVLMELAANFDQPSLLEVGVSDGSSARTLLENKSIFHRIILSDNHERFYEKYHSWGTTFYNGDKSLIGLKAFGLYLHLLAGNGTNENNLVPIETVNPEIKRLYDVQKIQKFDIFTDVLPEKIQLLKCANILNDSYFSKEQIKSAIDNLGQSLAEGGFLVASHNNEMYSEGEAYTVFQKKHGGMRFLKSINGHTIARFFSETEDKPEGLQQKWLLLIPSLEPGGAERQLIELANGLAQTGAEVHVVVFYGNGQLESTLSPEVKLYDLKKKGRWDVLCFSIRLVKLTRKLRPHILSAYLGVPCIASTLLKPFLGDTKVVWSVRASFVDLTLYDWLSRYCHAAENGLSHFADTIVVNSEAGYLHAQDRGFPTKKMILIPNGINTDIFAVDKSKGIPLRRQWGCPDSALLVGLPARIDPMKDHTTFIRAARTVLDSRNDIFFVCIGDGDPTLSAKYERLVKDLRLSEHFFWAGYQSDMQAAYNALDICCLSSLGEGFPNVLAEAMSCDIPCITTDVGDASRIVGSTGIVVPVRDDAKMAGAILETAKKIDTATTDGQRQRILRKFSTQAMIKASLQIAEQK